MLPRPSPSGGGNSMRTVTAQRFARSRESKRLIALVRARNAELCGRPLKAHEPSPEQR